jgi:hypothetical protein
MGKEEGRSRTRIDGQVGRETAGGGRKGTKRRASHAVK